MKLTFNQKRAIRNTIKKIYNFFAHPLSRVEINQIKREIKKKFRGRAIYKNLVIPDSCFISKSNSRGLIIRK